MYNFDVSDNFKLFEFYLFVYHLMFILRQAIQQNAWFGGFMGSTVTIYLGEGVRSNDVPLQRF